MEQIYFWEKFFGIINHAGFQKRRLRFYFFTCSRTKLMYSKLSRWNIPVFLRISFPKNDLYSKLFWRILLTFLLHVLKNLNLSGIVWKPMAATEIEPASKIWRKSFPKKLLKTTDLRPSKNNWERIYGLN